MRNWQGYRTVPTKILGDGTGGTTAPPDGWSRNSTYGLSTTKANPDPLIGYDTNGRCIAIRHSGAVVRDCYVWNDGTAAIGKFGIVIGTANNETAIGTVIEYCQIDGKATHTLNSHGIAGAIQERAGSAVTNVHTTTIRGCYIHHCGGDSINIFGGGGVVELNRLVIGGCASQGAHFDAIEFHNDRVGPGTEGVVQHNYFDPTPDADVNGSFGRTSSIAMTDVINGCYIGQNIIGPGNDVLDNGWNGSTYGAPSYGANPLYAGFATNANLRYVNNIIKPGPAGNLMWPTTRKGIVEWSNNRHWDDNTVLTNPGNT